MPKISTGWHLAPSYYWATSFYLSETVERVWTWSRPQCSLPAKSQMYTFSFGLRLYWKVNFCKQAKEFGEQVDHVFYLQISSECVGILQEKAKLFKCIAIFPKCCWKIIFKALKCPNIIWFIGRKEIFPCLSVVLPAHLQH